MGIPAPSSLPAVVDALWGLAQQALAADVIDEALYGPTPKGATPNQRMLAVFVGAPGATSRIQPIPGYDGVGYTEQVDVNCNAISWTGASDPLAIQRHLDAVYQILADLKSRIEGDPTLGGVCEQATLGQSHTPFPVNDSGGSSVELAFTIRTTAYI
jgi:hypothetical protein